ncbi:MAG: hypothetical protein ACPGTU_01240 [Myxococcota bacterium]
MRPEMRISLSTLILLLFANSAMAQETENPEEPPADDSEEEAPQEPPSELPQEVQGEAEAVPQLSRSQHNWLEPRRAVLPQNPYAQTDFTAYVLEWGETKIGAASITVGALPFTQIGTVPALDALGVVNGHVKVNMLRTDRFDMALGGNYFRKQAGDFVGSHTAGSALASIQVLDPWSMHMGLSYANLSSSGVPDLSQLPRILTGGQDPEAFQASQENNEDAWTFRGQTLKVNFATDIRFNRRDSLILQGSAIVWTSLERGFEAPPILGLEEAFAAVEDNSSPIAKSYNASVAWQWAWRRVDLRVGLGTSATPGAWLLQSTDLSYRFGGKTRGSERRMNRTWRRNKSDTK